MNESSFPLIKFLRPLIGLSIIFALIYFVGWDEIFARGAELDIEWALLSALLILCSTLLGSGNVYLLAHGQLSVSWLTFLPGFWMAWALSLVVPGQVGDILGLSLWMKRRGMRWEVGTAAATVDKLISLLWMLLFACWGLALYLGKPHLALTWVGSLAAGMCLFALGGYLMRERLRSLAQGEGVVRSIVQVILVTATEQPRQILFNVLLTPIKISLIAAAYWAMFHALGASSISLLNVLPLVAASSLVSYIPITFNGMGTVELAGVALFTQLGLETVLIVTAFLILRITVIALAWLPTAILFSLPSTSADRAA
jgi:uncharacterized membrane protein YbhN (UPF0104 family)